MKLSFSTLGCPNWKWSEILSAAVDLGYNGIELRGIGEDIFLPDVKMFSDEKIADTKQELSAKGIEIACISTECALVAESDPRERVAAYLALASKLGSPYIRVMGEPTPEPADGFDLGRVMSRLAALVPLAEKAGVTMLLESNGHLADSRLLKGVIEGTGSERVRALWDLHHPFRYFGESPETTAANIGAYVRHMHIKDSKIENGRLAYKMIGYGDLPIAGAFYELKELGYEGYVSLEWTKRWNEELEDAGIVFSHFVYATGKLWKEA